MSAATGDRGVAPGVSGASVALGESGAAAVPGGSGAATAVGALGFPDVPRLGLDELLVQLVDRAGDVLATQGRLRGLLRANALVAGDLSLPVVLRQIVRAARELLGARYAVLGVLGRDGRLEQFVHDGIDIEPAAGADDLPADGGGGGLTGESAPISVADLCVHPATAGFPPGRPPTAGFVGVPVRIGEEIFGNLHLTERTAGGEFTADDKELAIALAAAAGAAIANAWRFAESEQRRRWLDASALLTPLLLAADQRHPQALITEHAAAAADADFALLALPREPGKISVAAGAGPLSAGLDDLLAPLADSLAGAVIRIGKPSLITGHRLDEAATALGVGLGPLIVVPLAAGERILGALLLGRLAARPGFTESDLGMAASFGGHTAVAMELAHARADQLLLARAEDHDRIAGDLHDQVIGELFALGMKLQGRAARSDPATAARVNGYVDILDEVIKNIRTSIFGLRAPSTPPAAATGIAAGERRIPGDSPPMNC